MLFNSLTYLLFLTVMVATYWALPHRLRQPLLLAGSFVFYCAWRWEYGLLLLASIVANFYLARWIHRVRSRQSQWIAVGFNLALLGYYKYLGFFAETLNDLSSLVAGTHPIPLLDVVLPLGISFFTFQSMSYVVDVARREIDPEPHIVSFALYIAFWPQLVAGPIVRAHEIIPQFQREQRFSYEDLAVGLERIVYGLFLKVVLADNIAPFVDEGFLETIYRQNSALDNWTLAFAFGFQIYFDFAGYSSIALGSARLMGFRLPVNFNFPYAASSPQQFWQRWHITLSSWIRDYLLFPLEGALPGPSRSTGGIEVAGPVRAPRRHNTALVVTWMLLGLWHGAAWMFLIWGLWHAGMALLYRGWLAIGRRVESVRRVTLHPLLGTYVGLLLTLAGSMASWILFRAQSFEQAGTMLASLVDPSAYGTIRYKENYYLLTFAYTVGFFALYFVRERITEGMPGAIWARVGWVVRAAGYAIMVLLIAGFLRSGQQFIYFQF